MPSEIWAEDEESVLSQNYQSQSKDELQKVLPNRTWKAIISHAYKRHLKRPNNSLWQEGEFHKKLERFDLGFIVGLIEGEGHIALGLHSMNKNPQSLYLIPRLHIANTKLPLLEKCHEILGCGHIRKRQYKTRVHHDWTECYYFEITKFIDILNVLLQLEPFLISKRRHAKLVIEYLQLRMKKPRGEQFIHSGEELALYTKIRQLNETRGSKYVRKY